MALITGDLDYVMGHLRYGHKELILKGEELEQFKSMSEEDQKEWLQEYGELVIDDFCLDDYGAITEIRIGKD